MSFLPGRARIGETTDTLNHLEGDLTVVQDSNSEASKELSALEREAKALNLTSAQLHRQLDILKNSNFLGNKDPMNRTEAFYWFIPVSLIAINSHHSLILMVGKTWPVYL